MKTLGKKALWHKRFKNEDWGAEDQRGGVQMLGAERQQRIAAMENTFYQR